jgi:methionine-rich copper-binding protein CopC
VRKSDYQRILAIGTGGNTSSRDGVAPIRFSYQPKETQTMARKLTMHIMMACSVLMLSGNTGAFAHPRLVSAVPAVAGTVRSAPSEVTLRFNERLEAAFTSVVIRDSEGKQVDKGDAKLDKSDRKILRVSVPPLAPGMYKVEWHAMSADTHKIEGDFTFNVGP